MRDSTVSLASGLNKSSAWSFHSRSKQDQHAACSTVRQPIHSHPPGCLAIQGHHPRSNTLTYFALVHFATAPPKRVPVKTNELDNQQKTKANSHVSNLKEIPYSDGNLLVNARVNLSFLNSFTANSGAKISPEETSTYFLHHRTHPNRPKQYHDRCFSTIRPMGIRNIKLVLHLKRLALLSDYCA